MGHAMKLASPRTAGLFQAIQELGRSALLRRALPTNGSRKNQIHRKEPRLVEPQFMLDALAMDLIA